MINLIRMGMKLAQFMQKLLDYVLSTFSKENML
jgi:hypothetical protein